MFCELMGALIFNLKWLKTGKKGSLFLSLLFFLSWLVLVLNFGFEQLCRFFLNG